VSAQHAAGCPAPAIIRHAPQVLIRGSCPGAHDRGNGSQEQRLVPQTYDLGVVAPAAGHESVEPQTVLPNDGMPKPPMAVDANPFDTRIGTDATDGSEPTEPESLSGAIAQAGAVLLGQLEKWKSSWFESLGSGSRKRSMRDPCYVPGFAASASPPTQAHSSSAPAVPKTDSRLNQVSIEYTEDELRQATQNFDVSNLLGSGACGNVYSGKMKDGTLVAIKLLKAPEKTGFDEEVQVLSRFRHPNLVILMGFARHEHLSGCRSLVYEYLAGGDVSSRLNRSRKREESFEARLRVSVALDAASGLSHMHNATPRAFHRDIKCPNILLDKNGTAKMADFGLACVSRSSTHQVERVGGTAGYMCPDYARTGMVTEYSEVYSFGMVILELLTGVPPAVIKDPKKPDDLDFLVTRLKGSRHKAVELKDVSADMSDALAGQLADLAFACIVSTTTQRPFFVAVVEALRDLLSDAARPQTLACLPTADSKVPLPLPPGLDEVVASPKSVPETSGGTTTLLPVQSFGFEDENWPSTPKQSVDWPQEHAAGVLQVPVQVLVEEE